MQRRSSALALCLAAAAAMAQQKPEEKPASIEGIVTHAITGAPVLRAHVMCDGFAAGKPQQFGAMTDAEGKFSIRSLPPGNYSVTVERIGFLMPFEKGRRGIQLMLRPDSTSEAKLKLTPTGAILGRVIDPDGNPMEGVMVFADGASFGNRTATVMTDHKGQYRIGGLATGRYRVRASLMAMPLPPEIRTDGSEEVRYVSTFHPSALDSKSATRVEVRSGADLSGIDIRLQRAPMVRISGVVTGIAAEASPRAVQIQTRNEMMSGSSQMAGADGKFELWNLDPGKWLVSAECNSRGEQLRSAALEIEVGTQHIDGLELRMTAPFDVTGQAVFEDESAKPRPSASNAPPPRMALQEVNRLGGSRGTQPVVLPADGSFKFTNVQPGRYRINFGWRASIKSIRLGTVEMENNILDLSAGTGGAPVTVVFAPATAEVAGTVRDDKGPVAGATVVMRNSGISIGSTNGAYTIVTGPDGAYRFTNVPSGKYLLLAADEGESNLMSDTYEDYEDISVEVEVGIGDKIARDLKRHSRSR